MASLCPSHGLALLAALGCFSCLGSATSPALAPLPAGGHHVLFIGNSLTYVNDLPATVAAIAQSAGDTIRVATEAQPNLALIDHLTGGSRAVDHIAVGGWEYVVLQQGPTPRGICRDSLILWTKLFDPLIRAVGAKPALFMTWPAIDQLGIFDDVRTSFQMAAAAVNGVFMPAGEAWRAALRVDPTLGVYGPDGFHPSPIGTFVAALEIYERITGRDPRTLPPRAFSNGREFALPEPTVRALQSAAHDANSAFPASPAMLSDTVRTTNQGVGHC
jgi:hypothetical protein